MKPPELVEAWVEAFNKRYILALTASYSDSASDFLEERRYEPGSGTLSRLWRWSAFPKIREDGKLTFLRLHGLPLPAQ
jgi:hypothetical protein